MVTEGTWTTAFGATVTVAELLATTPVEPLQAMVYVIVPAANGMIDCELLVAVALAAVMPAPVTLQLAASFDDHVTVVELPSVREAGVAEIFAVGTGASTVTSSEA